MSSKSVHFKFEKATKNTYKYEEDPQDNAPKIVGSLYIQKHVFGAGTPPHRVLLSLGWEVV